MKRIAIQAGNRWQVRLENSKVYLAVASVALPLAAWLIAVILDAMAVTIDSALLQAMFIVVVGMLIIIAASAVVNVRDKSRSKYLDALEHLHKANHIIRDFHTWLNASLKTVQSASEVHPSDPMRFYASYYLHRELLHRCNQTIELSASDIQACYNKIIGGQIHVSILGLESSVIQIRPGKLITDYRITSQAESGYLSTIMSRMLSRGNNSEFRSAYANKFIRRLTSPTISGWSNILDDAKYEYNFFVDNGLLAPLSSRKSGGNPRMRSWFAGTISAKISYARSVSDSEYVRSRGEDLCMAVEHLGVLSVMSDKPYAFRTTALENEPNELIFAYTDSLYLLLSRQRFLRDEFRKLVLKNKEIKYGGDVKGERRKTGTSG